MLIDNPDWLQKGPLAKLEGYKIVLVVLYHGSALPNELVPQPV